MRSIRTTSRHWGLAALLAVSLAGAQLARGQSKAAQIDELLTKYSELGLFNGAALVAQNNQVVFKKGYGFANMEWEIPNTPAAKFRLGSITKQFTSMLIMQLVAAGKIELEAPLSRYLPYYRKDTGERVTIRHLLTHTSGIPSYTSLPNFMQDKTRDTYAPRPFVEQYCSGDLEFEPGSNWAYNNSGYFILGAVIEEVTGRPYADVLEEKILQPLGMHDTGYDLQAPIIARRAAGYERDFAGIVNAPFLDMSIPYAAGSLYSTVEDLYLWDQALYSDRLLPAEWKEVMFTPFKNDYAFGWYVSQVPLGGGPKKILRHGGGIFGFNTLIVRLVDDHHLIVLLNNTGATTLDAMAMGIAHLLYNEPAEPPRQPVSNYLHDKIQGVGLAAAIEDYRKQKSAGAPGIDFREFHLNRLGYYFLRKGQTETAIAIFKLNVEAYPKSWNVYDSLGEAYMNAGNKALAIENYEKSVQLNPENRSGLAALARLKAGN